jgi:hypothetical protein
MWYLVADNLRKPVAKSMRELVSESMRELVSESMRELVSESMRELVSESMRELVAKSLWKFDKLMLSLGDAAAAVDLACRTVPHVVNARALTAYKVHLCRTRLKFSTLDALLYRCMDISRLSK